MSWQPFWKLRSVQSSENQSWKKPFLTTFPTKAGQDVLQPNAFSFLQDSGCPRALSKRLWPFTWYLPAYLF